MLEKLNTTTTEANSHLDSKIKGAEPIMACLVSSKDIIKIKTKQSPEYENIDTNFGLDNPQNVHWNNPFPELEEDFLRDGKFSYVISSINDNNKFSKSFFVCTGLVVAGIDKDTGENISFLTHQAPFHVLKKQEKQNKFITDLKKRLVEFSDRCVPHTIDVVVGGHYFDSTNFKHPVDVNGNNGMQNYLEPIKLLGKEVQEVLKFQPIVINGPSEQSDVFYDNKNRRLYLAAVEINPKINSFPANEVEEHKDKF